MSSLEEHSFLAVQGPGAPGTGQDNSAAVETRHTWITSRSRYSMQTRSQPRYSMQNLWAMSSITLGIGRVRVTYVTTDGATVHRLEQALSVLMAPAAP